MTSVAVSAVDTYFAIKVGEEWKRFQEVKSTPELGESPDKIDVTHLGSKMKEYIKDIPDFSSDLEFVMNAMPTESTDSNYDLIKTLDPNQSYEFKVGYPQLGIMYVVTGDWVWRMGAGAVSTAMEITFVVIPRSALTDSKIDDTFALSYNLNGGSGLPEVPQTYNAGASTVTPTADMVTAPEGKVLLGWNTQADGLGITYKPGSNIDIYNNTQLYAVWGTDVGNADQ